MEAEGVAQPVKVLAVTRDWSELPQDTIESVFSKLGAVEILMGTGFVCRSWLDAAMEPYLWRSLDMASPNIAVIKERCRSVNGDVLRAMAKKAVDRSNGQLDVFIGEGFVDDGLLNYIREKAPSLKVLGLHSCFSISTKGFIQAVRKFPLLEELKLSACGHICGRATYEAVGKACQNLRNLELVNQLCWPYSFGPDDARWIATMHGLRYLMISHSDLTNKELAAILDNCPQLQSLDLHSCLNIFIDDAIRAKYAAITISMSSTKMATH